MQSVYGEFKEGIPFYTLNRVKSRIPKKTQVQSPKSQEPRQLYIPA